MATLPQTDSRPVTNEPLERLFILTGDPSGDIHAAHVVKALRETHHWHGDIAAIGGPALKEAGVYLLSEQANMGLVGISSLLSTWRHYWLGRKILDFLAGFQPQTVMLVDYGGFNLWMAEQIKRRFGKQIRLVYYIPPQVWASRRHRINTIKHFVDHVCCIFPFEVPLYQKMGIPVTYVGHPLMTQLPPPADRQTFCRRHGLNPHEKIIAVFPGSRKMEIGYLLQPLVMATAHLQKTLNQPFQVVIARSRALSPDGFKNQLLQIVDTLKAKGFTPPNITVIESEDNQQHALQSVADVALVKSGTSTLETALYKTPMVIVYKGHWLVAIIAKKVCYLPFLGLPNILAQSHLVTGERVDNDTWISTPAIPEFLQEKMVPETIAQTVLTLLDPASDISQRQKEAYWRIQERMQTHMTQSQTTTQATSPDPAVIVANLLCLAKVSPI